MGQYRLDDHRIFDTGNHLGGATADSTGFHTNVASRRLLLMNTRLSRPLKGPTFGAPTSLPHGVARVFSHPARLRLSDCPCPAWLASPMLGVCCSGRIHRGRSCASMRPRHSLHPCKSNRVSLTRGLGTRAASFAMTCKDALMPRAQDAQERSRG